MLSAFLGIAYVTILSDKDATLTKQNIYLSNLTVINYLNTLLDKKICVTSYFIVKERFIFNLISKHPHFGDEKTFKDHLFMQE